MKQLITTIVFSIIIISASAEEAVPHIPTGEIIELVDRINKLEQEIHLNYAIPTGTIAAYNGSVAPRGWMMCDGSTIPVEFKNLRKVCGNNVPDYRGMFLRGLNNNRNDGREDPNGKNRKIGSFQGDQFRAHDHTFERFEHPTIVGSGLIKTGITSSSVDRKHPLTGETGGDETRPRNIAVNWIIKQ